MGTTGLQFKIDADATAAQAELAKFRQSLSGDLKSIEGNFASWGQSIFSKLTTVQAGVAAGAAVAASAVGR